ncbi:cupin domain-containing protein [Parashewanella tropica]|uniref:cupin domain-containing protein n=1 Tax=Parashewanella tropica TaxID=2547970 RepID=UPI00105A876E|nr:cupin domain-containing protein [Parashewanella tropica]
MSNLFSNIPNSLPEEVFEDLHTSENLRIERILSHGHSSPNEGWYDQTENEWVIVLKGQGVIEFESGEVFTLSEGDFVNIPAGKKHKVVSTNPDKVTVWLAIFYK